MRVLRARLLIVPQEQHGEISDMRRSLVGRATAVSASGPTIFIRGDSLTTALG